MNLPRFDANRLWLWCQSHIESCTDWTRDHFGFPMKSRAQKIRDDMLRAGGVFRDVEIEGVKTEKKPA